MALLSSQDRQVVQQHFAGIAHDVTLLFFTQTIGAPEGAAIAKQILDEVASLSDRVHVEEASFVLERERAAQYGFEDIPAIALLRDGADTRMRFLGAPAGYEFMSLVEAVALAGGDDSGLSQDSKDLVASQVTSPLDIKVFATPTCPHCPRAILLAHQLAVESPLITATGIEATEFMDLSRRFRVTGVPKTIVNGSIEILGALPEPDFVRQVIGAEVEKGHP